MTEFEGIVPALAQALEKRGFAGLTPVQQAMIDPDLAELDALVSAQTGSGKTVAFGLALAPTLLGDAQKFEPAFAPTALVVTPTRELAMQVMRELEWLYAETGAQVTSCVGGMDFRTERRALERGAHIVVGTPGRLRDHIERKSLDLAGLRAVVLDEADEMLDLGFREDLEFILQAAPTDRRTLLFSATVSKPIAALAQSYQRNARRISVAGEKRQHVDIDYRALQVASGDRENAIINLLRFYEAQNALVFCSTRAAVNHLMARFHNRGFAVVALSGELSQTERSHALQAMRDGRARVCIATDVAARGIDLPGLELVIHADLPGNRETLLHRSGRTGRAGQKGVSALIVAPSDRKKAERLLSSAAIQATWARPPSADEVMARDNDRLMALLAEPEAGAEGDADLIAQITATFPAERLAAGFLGLWRAGRSAPEELRDGPAEGPRRDHATFGESVWLTLSVGRHQNAEPRWLLPMLCTAGQITKSEIGAIRMMDDETHVQILASCAEGFLTAIGPDMMLEKGITLRMLDHAPDTTFTPRAPRPQSDRAFGDRGRSSDRGTSERGHSERPAAPRKPRHEGGAPKPRFDDDRPRPPRPDRPDRAERAERAPRAARAPREDFTRDGAVSKYEAKPKDSWSAKPRPSAHASPERGAASGYSDSKPRTAPAGKPAGKPYGKAKDDSGFRDAGPKPSGKPAAPRAPSFDPSDPSASRRKPGAKPGAKPSFKPGAKAGAKPAGRSFSRSASDTPKRPKPKG